MGEINGAVVANYTRLNQVCGQQWLAMGDAMSFNPLSSQGMFNAMAGAMQLAELILKFRPVDDFNTINTATFQNTYQYQMYQVWDYYLKHKHYFYR